MTVALITGGASGIGRAMTLDLAARGYRIAILDRNADGLAAVAAQSPNITPFECDVTDDAQVKQVVAQVEHELGPVDRFVHCAAVMPGGRLDELPTEQINRTMQINYFGTVNATQAMLPYMRQRNCGEFVVLGSIAGVVPTEKFGAYGATKSATNFYMQVLMQENDDTDIRFLLVCPSAVRTPLIEQAVEKGPKFLRPTNALSRSMATTAHIVKAVERGLQKNRRIVYPREANLLQFAYRLAPWLSRIVGKRIV